MQLAYTIRGKHPPSPPRSTLRPRYPTAVCQPSPSARLTSQEASRFLNMMSFGFLAKTCDVSTALQSGVDNISKATQTRAKLPSWAFKR
jgi:hypothetical protein